MVQMFDYLGCMHLLYGIVKLFLVTDFFGEKPLFIFEHEDKILFSSEVNFVEM